MDDPNRKPEQFNILDRTQNPSAFATIDLLSIINASELPRSISEILEQRNGGIYPTRTSEELQILEDSRLIDRVDGEKGQAFRISNLGRMELLLQGVKNPLDVQRAIRRAFVDIGKCPPELPQEKYGIEEFRFTWDSVADLMNKIIKDNSHIKPKVLALGVPTVHYFASQCADVVDCYLLDINQDIVDSTNKTTKKRAVKASVYDAREPIPPTFSGKFDAVVFDPPWHNEFYSLFADRAYELLRSYGKLYISTPAPATRPEAAGELNEIYANLMAGGFSLIEICPEFFGYEIPDFERRVFVEHGIDVNNRGKYGQLVVAQANPGRTSTCSTPESIALTEKERSYSIKIYDDVDLGDFYLSDDSPNDEQIPLQVRQFSKGVYLTTSRSTRRSHGVNLITRDHIAFVVNNPKKFMALCELSRTFRGTQFIDAIMARYNIRYAEAEKEAQQFYKTNTLLEGN